LEDALRLNSTKTLNSDRLGQIIAFIEVARLRSFIEASVSLSTSSSTVSRKISKLEDALGVRLFERSTRNVALTDAGQIYFEECSGVMENLVHADMKVSALSEEVRGSLRISAPAAFGRLHVTAVISDFINQHPGIQVEVNYTDRYVDLIEEGYDLVVRTGCLTDSTLVARKIADNHRILVASPAYLEKHGAPASPDDLAAHECVTFSRYAASGNTWRFQQDGDIVSARVGGRFRSDNSETVCDAVANGLGIGLVAHYICHGLIRSGALVPLLTDWTVHPAAGIYIVHHSKRLPSANVRTLSDFLAQHLETAPWRHRPTAPIPTPALQ
jgi:DNA-binding transcriptional LysR family regulator